MVNVYIPTTRLSILNNLPCTAGYRDGPNNRAKTAIAIPGTISSDKDNGIARVIIIERGSRDVEPGDSCAIAEFTGPFTVAIVEGQPMGDEGSRLLDGKGGDGETHLSHPSMSRLAS